MAAAARAQWSWSPRARPAVVATAVAAAAGGASSAPALPPGAKRRARARLQKQRQRQEQQLIASPSDDDLNCPHALAPTGPKHCSGCSLTTRQAIAVPPCAAEARRFFQPLLLDAKSPPFTVLAGPTHGWRCRARLAVRWAGDDDGGDSKKNKKRRRRRQLAFGLFRSRSHALGPDLTGSQPNSTACPVHHPLLNEVLRGVKGVAEELGVEAYDEEEERKGALRYVQATVVRARAPTAGDEEDEDEDGDDNNNTSSLAVQLVLVVNAEKDGGGEISINNRSSVSALAAELWRRRRESEGGNKPRRPLPLHSVRVNCQPRADSNAVLGPEWLDGDEDSMFGPEFGWVALGPPPAWALATASSSASLPAAWAAVAPGGFTQANQGAMRAAAAAVAEAVLEPVVEADQSTRPVRAVVDLFAGAGALGLAVAAAKAARGEEEEDDDENDAPSPFSVECVEINARCAPAFRAAREALVSSKARDYLLPELRVADCSFFGGGLAAGAARELFCVGGGGGGVGGRSRPADVVIVDPPRKGLGAEMTRALTVNEADDGALLLLPRRLVYLSCGWAALRRDAAALLGLEEEKEERDVGSGRRRVRWTLRSARAFVFFPGTDAIETLCVFERALMGGVEG